MMLKMGLVIMMEHSSKKKKSQYKQNRIIQKR